MGDGRGEQAVLVREDVVTDAVIVLIIFLLPAALVGVFRYADKVRARTEADMRARREEERIKREEAERKESLARQARELGEKIARENAAIFQAKRRAEREEEVRRAESRRRREEDRGRREEDRKDRQRADELWASPQAREEILDAYLRWLFGSSNGEFAKDSIPFRGALLPRAAISRARSWASREGYVLYDGRRWRLSGRGQRLFEEYGGSRKKMSSAEKKHQQPNIKIDARGAGTVAHTIKGGVHGTTVNHGASAGQMGEVDLATALQLIAQLRQALPDADSLSALNRDRAVDELRSAERELQASEEDRDPGRIRRTLEGLRAAVVGADGLVQMVNQLWDHVHVLFRT